MISASNDPPLARVLMRAAAMPTTPRQLGRIACWMLANLAISATSIAAPAVEPALPPSIQSVFASAGIPAESIAVVVEKLVVEKPDLPAAGQRTSQRMMSSNTGKAMNPASVIKLFTTAAALDLLGPTHVWPTELRASKAPVNGRLDGALYLKGGGDPSLNLEQFWLLLRQLRLNGVRDIRGDLIIDRSLFALPAHDPAAFDGLPLRPYNVGADAALVNFGAIRVLLRPNPTGSNVEALLETPDSHLKLRNRLTIATGDCGDWRDRVEVRLDGATLDLSGGYPRSCGEKTLGLAPLAANAQIDGLFRALWRELGGTLKGRVLSGTTPTDSLVLARHESPPLPEIIRPINKYSNNVMARQVFLALSAGTPPASYEKSAARLREWLTVKGITAPELVIENGAGLSRQDRSSADTLAALLRMMWQQPAMADFMASLPIFGEDGTLKKRGNGQNGARVSKGRAHLKTGYIEGVRALAGYVLDKNGERWLLVAMINHPNAIRGKEGMDALVDWVVNR